ncbi:MAG: tRNA (adenosine(37)-N6)-threonylcarbamoyltransferase complex dimerization subunit type 1 TsaB [Tannerella sp.]|jgi:tRNA threonylcarbamoyladenosine biosynthesis protein TsaB|nr:tRNA (adenosine(37)-N6)-threonylcarbamoyltransferase complex dimerization subunit type 1 TsaB [Tannerella sp.]
MTILNIETAATICSVAVSENENIIFEQVSTEVNSHSSKLGVFVENALKEVTNPIDAVAVSSGPGSYTGLRIGVSMAKGLCFGYQIPLLGVPTLEIMASVAIRRVNDGEMLYCPMIDARRMEVYSALYDSQLKPVSDVKAEIITGNSYAAMLDVGKICFFGNGAAKCQMEIKSPNAMFINDINPLASDMCALSAKRFQAGQFEDVAYFEPFYLKEFVAVVAKNKVIH